MNYSLPLESPRKYQGTLHISSPPPQVVLGDPGSIQVAPLTTTTAQVTDETVGGRSAVLQGKYGLLEVSVSMGWKLPPGLAREVVIPPELTRGCRVCEQTKFTGTYLLERVSLRYPGEPPSQGVPVDPNNPVALEVFSTFTDAEIGDGNGFSYPGGPIPAAFPETGKAALDQLLSQPPEIVFFQAGAPGGFSFGGPAEDSTPAACLIVPESGATFYIYGVINGRNGTVLSGPAIASAPGQPCGSKLAQQ